MFKTYRHLGNMEKANLTVNELCERVTASLLNLIFSNDFQLDVAAGQTPEIWVQNMSTGGVYAVHYFTELTSESSNRKI